MNEADKNTKKWLLETFPVTLKSDAAVKMDMALHSTDTSFFLKLMGSGTGTGTIDKGSRVIFLLDNDSTVAVRSVAIQSMDFAAAPPSYEHEYKIGFDALEMLSQHDLQALRKYSAGGYDDIEIDKKDAGIVKELSRFFIGELTTAKLVPSKNNMVLPHFPGGEAAYVKFLNRNFKAVPDLQDTAKKAVVQFMIGEDGAVQTPEVKESAGGGIDAELLRVLKRMPNWKPAAQNEKQVNYLVTQKVVFTRTGSSVNVQLQPM